MRIKFEPEYCIVCGLCFNAYSYHAIEILF